MTAKITFSPQTPVWLITQNFNVTAIPSTHLPNHLSRLIYTFVSSKTHECHFDTIQIIQQNCSHACTTAPLGEFYQPFQPHELDGFKEKKMLAPPDYSQSYTKMAVFIPAPPYIYLHHLIYTCTTGALTGYKTSFAHLSQMENTRKFLIGYTLGLLNQKDVFLF